MARVVGPWMFRGTINGVTVDKNGVARRAVGPREVTAERSLENISEFAAAARTGKAIREALGPLEVKDSLITSRMMRLVRLGMNLDTVNGRGSRVLSRTEAMAVLPGFELNDGSRLQSVMPSEITADSTTIAVKSSVGVPITPNDVSAPGGATHVELRGLTAVVNTLTNVVGDITVATSGEQRGAAGLTLSPALPVVAPAVADEILIAAVAVRFYQEVNSRFYLLSNGVYNAARIVAVV